MLKAIINNILSIFFGLFFFHSALAELNEGDILVSDGQSDTVIQVDPLTGVQTPLLPIGTFNPLGIAFGKENEIYVCTFGKILQLNPNTGVLDTIIEDSLIGQPYDMIATPSGKFLFVDATKHNVVEFDPIDLSLTILASGGFLNRPTSIALDNNNIIFVTSLIDGSIVKIDPNNNFTQSVVDDNGLLSNPGGIVIDKNNTIYVTDSSGIIKIDAQGATLLSSSVNGLLHDSKSITIDGNSDLLVLAGPKGSAESSIIKVDPVTGAQSKLSPELNGVNNFISTIDIVLVPKTIRKPATAYIAFSSLNDINGNSFPELAALSVLESGKPQVIIKDAQDKNTIRKINFLSSLYIPFDMTIVPDMNGNGADEIAVIGTSTVDGNIRTQIRDSLSREILNNVFFPE